LIVNSDQRSEPVDPNLPIKIIEINPWRTSANGPGRASYWQTFSSVQPTYPLQAMLPLKSACSGPGLV